MPHEYPDRLLDLLEQLLKIEAIEFRDVLQQAASLVAQALGSEKVDIFLYEEEIHTLVALGVSNTPLGDLQRSLGMNWLPIANGGRTVSVFQTGETYSSGRVNLDPEELPGVKEGLGICSTIAVTLDIGGKRRGVIQTDMTQADFFTEQDVRFLEGVAHWMGIMAHRAELIQQVAHTAAKQARRMAAEELMTVLAHDLRNYLTPIQGRLGLLQRRATREQRQQDLQDIAGIGAALQRFDRLTADLMDMGRLSQGLFTLTYETINLASLVQDIAAALQTPLIQIDVQIPGDLLLWADANRLRQALENLLANAIKHSPAGKTVLIAVERQEEPAKLVISISDQGPGISPEVLPYLFEPFRAGPDSNGTED